MPRYSKSKIGYWRSKLFQTRLKQKFKLTLLSNKVLIVKIIE